jgi:methyl-accepting chemotaxis protein
MRLVRQLVVRLVVVLCVPALASWYVASTFFPLSEAQHAALHQVMPACALADVLLCGLAFWALLRPVRGTLALAPGDAAPARRAAAMAAVRIPSRLAALLVVVGALRVVAVAALEIAQGFPEDVALAGAASAAAFGIVVAMLGYSVAAAGVAPALAELGSVEVGEGGTVRRKVLVVCYGLLATATLLIGSVAYARFRADTDRVYIDGAAAAQREATGWLAAHGPGAAAELVHVAVGAPTVVLSRGAVVGRAGEGDLAFLTGAVEQGAGLDVVPGGWRLRRAAGPFTIVTYLPEEPLWARRQAFGQAVAAIGLVLFAVAALLVGLAAKSLTAPLAFLGRAAHRIAGGDLTASPPSVTRDEMGRLAADFRRMTQGLSALVEDVQAATRSVHDGAREMGRIGERVKGGAKEEHERVVAVHGAVEAMQGSVALVGRGIDGLSEYVHSTSAAVGEMAAALEEVRRQAAELERRMETAGADVERLSDAGRRAQTQLSTLDALAHHAHGTLASVSGSLSGLETSAVASQLAAAQAAEMAEHAGGIVQQAVTGIESVRTAVGETKLRVAVLGRRSDDIDQILDFIGEVAGRTNLLSLNASIIATQAGEHGKAFAVVADQIRELAAQISSSTKSIGEIIGAVRDDVASTARLIDKGDELAGAGVAHARRSLDALHEIRAATAKGHETAAAIRDAVQAHAQSTRDVSNLVTSVADDSHLLSEAVGMVGKSVAAVGAVSRGVAALADKVSRALEEQSGLGRRQLESLEKINAMLEEITRAVESHEVATRRVREALSHLTRTAEQHEAAVVELSGVAGRLGGRSRALAESVGRFKI